MPLSTARVARIIRGLWGIMGHHGASWGIMGHHLIKFTFAFAYPGLSRLMIRPFQPSKSLL